MRLADSVIPLLGNNLSDAEVARRAGCSESYVRKLRCIRGIPPSDSKKEDKWSQYKDEIEKLLREGVSRRELMIRFKISSLKQLRGLISRWWPGGDYDPRIQFADLCLSVGRLMEEGKTIRETMSILKIAHGTVDKYRSRYRKMKQKR